MIRSPSCSFSMALAATPATLVTDEPTATTTPATSMPNRCPLRALAATPRGVLARLVPGALLRAGDTITARFGDRRHGWLGLAMLLVFPAICLAYAMTKVVIARRYL